MDGTRWIAPGVSSLVVITLVGVTMLAAVTVTGAAAGTGEGAGNATGEGVEQQGATCDLNRVYDDAIPSVVTIRTFDPGGERGLGSGWVYGQNETAALLVTNYHVIADSLGADVRFADGEWRNVGALVGVDPYADLAVLRVEDVPDGVTTLDVSRSLPDQGDEVAALGSPLGLEGSIVRGIVSAVDRSVTVGTEGDMYTIVDAIQIDAPLSPGNSGGPLVNCNGDLVGVNFAGVSPLAGQNVNFALSGAMVSRIVPSLVENGTYEHSYMGIRGVTLSPTMSRINGLDATTQGVLVDSVVAGGPGDGALEGSGVTEHTTSIPVGGDVIVAVNDSAVGDVDDLREYLFEHTRPGDTVDVTVLRDGERQTVAVTLGPRPLARERISTEPPAI